MFQLFQPTLQCIDDWCGVWCTGCLAHHGPCRMWDRQAGDYSSGYESMTVQSGNRRLHSCVSPCKACLGSAPSIEWSSTTILDGYPQFHQCLVREAIRITTQPNLLIREDGLLPVVYIYNYDGLFKAADLCL